jgi:hypothetical protein
MILLRPGKFIIFTFMLEDQLKLSKNSISPWLLPVVGKSPCGQVDCLKELDPTLRQKVINVDTDFLSNPYKPTHEKDGKK